MGVSSLLKEGAFVLCLLNEEDSEDQEVGGGKKDAWSLPPVEGWPPHRDCDVSKKYLSCVKSFRI